MGIPKFARWISSRYRRCLARSLPGPAHGLLIDMNGIIHPACHDDGQQLEGGEKEMIERVLVKVESLIETVNPGELVYLAIDGVAPRAKMKQQRIRRYMSAFGRSGGEEVDVDEPLEPEEGDAQEGEGNAAAGDDNSDGLMSDGEQQDIHNELQGLDLGVLQINRKAMTAPIVAQKSNLPLAPTEVFDDNSISPGTGFMVRVAEALKAKCQTWKTKYPNVTFVISDTQVPGEGEHKLIDFIRKNGNPSKKYVIHGNDADLILLTLLLHNRTIILMKEGKWGTQVTLDYYVVDEIRKGLARDLNRRIQKLNPGLAKSSSAIPSMGLIEDFVFLTTMVGNDFLPHLPTAFISEHTLDNFLEVYAHSFAAMQGFITDVNGLSPQRLGVFLRNYASVETSFFRYRMKTLNQMAESELGSPLGSPVDNKWRSTYYKTTGLHDVQATCKKFIEGITWVFGYYTLVGCTDWTWEYPFSHAPLTYDLMVYLSTYQGAHIPFPSSAEPPLPPLLQLTCILPPASKALVPEPLRKLWDLPELADCFPDRWKVDYTGADKEYMAIIMFPPLNNDKLLTAARALIPNVSAAEQKLNVTNPAPVVIGDEALALGVFDTKTNDERVAARKTLNFTMEVYKSGSWERMLNRKYTMNTVIPSLVGAALLGSIIARPSAAKAISSIYAFAIAYFVSGSCRPLVPRPYYEERKPKEVFRDWLCVHCNVRNFERNVNCFVCQRDYDETKCPAVLSLMHASTQHFDIDHQPNIREIRPNQKK
eukprot:PhF_6_TR40782/c0_g1_i3/m.61554